MYAVIMAGGSGTRFWPYSRRGKPKQFLNISGKAPMVVETCDRLKPIARDEELILVLGEEHLKEAKGLFGDRPVHMIAEPVGRNTAPCIGLGAIYAQHLGCRDPVAFLPADHFIGDNKAYLDALCRAANLAESGAIVTLGIVPTRPETGYGYIQRAGLKSDVSGESGYRVTSFVEKPDLETAGQYLSSGEHFWNAGIFLATPETVLAACRKYLPDLYEGLNRLRENLGRESFHSNLATLYGSLTPLSFDNGIMEKIEEPVFVIPCECGWSDVGSWSSLYDLRQEDYDKERNCSEGDTVLIDCRESFISSRGGRLTACLGLKNCLVVDTPNALLVADLERSQEIRKIIERLKLEGKEDLL